MDIVLVAGMRLDGSAWDDVVPELAKTKHLEFVDIDSRHWPMHSAPAELARLLATAAAFNS